MPEISINISRFYFIKLNHLAVLMIVIYVLIPSVFAQINSNNPYKLRIINSAQIYKEMISKDSENVLVDLKKYIPSLKLDIRYAGSNNFLHEPVYKYAKAFLRKPAASALLLVQKELNKAGLGLKIFDAYRPYSATLKFWDKVRDTQYVAAPWTGSRHNRGCAVDLTIISLKSGEELDMPIGFDSFRLQAHSDNINLSADKIKNRDLLIGVMAKYGFENLPTEWWHYDFKDWVKFDLMDISFEQLENIQ